VFARAVIQQSEKDDPSLLEGYSDTCLRHIWQHQVSAVWITEIMHNAGDSFLSRGVPQATGPSRSGKTARITRRE
jgi:hypothetical protein